MSKDLQLAWPCNHLIVEERVTLGSDRQSLPTRMPILSSTLVSVLADSTTIPQTGLQIPARLKSFAPGPYEIITNEQDLTLVTSSATYTYTLLPGTYLAEQIAQRINRQANLASVERGMLVLADNQVLGDRSLIQVMGRAVSGLHFKQTGATGRQLYPGWSLVTPPLELTARYPRFNQTIPTNPELRVTYVTDQSRCLRCQASGVENDYRFTVQASGTVPAGSLIMIQNEDLLYQGCLKILLTQQGSNPYHPEYGTTILSRIGSKATMAVAAALSAEVRRALTAHQTMQRQQGKVQRITLKEQLYSILNVQTFPSADDPTVFFVEVTVQNASSEPVVLNIVYATKGVHSTVNGMTLG